MKTPSIIHRSQSSAVEVDQAIDELLASTPDESSLNIIFATTPYDLKALGAGIKSRCNGTVIGCTTAGHIGPTGFQKAGAALLTFSGSKTFERTWVIENLAKPEKEIAHIRAEVNELLEHLDAKTVFGVLLVDGLCHEEERLSASLFAAMPSVPMVGGSAGDQLTFQATHVLFDGEFRQGIATFTLVSTDMPFSVFSLKHHHPTETRLAITKSDPVNRSVLEINGYPAAEAYAASVGVSVDDLGPSIYAKHPLMFRVGREYFIRSPFEITPDGAINFLCAIDVGDIVRIGESRTMLESLASEMQAVYDVVGGAQAILVFDCILRRVEFEEHGLAKDAGDVMSRSNATGFCTYGEQLGSVHINHTMVGIAFGPSAAVLPS